MIEQCQSAKDSLLACHRDPKRGTAGEIEGRQQGVESIPVARNDDAPGLAMDVFAECGWQCWRCFKVAAGTLINPYRLDVIQRGGRSGVKHHAAYLQQFTCALKCTKQKIVFGATECGRRTGGDQRIANLFYRVQALGPQAAVDGGCYVMTAEMQVIMRNTRAVQ